MCECFSGYNLPVVLHSDGNLTHILPSLVSAGFKGLHPLESAAGMDIVDLKERLTKPLWSTL